MSLMVQKKWLGIDYSFWKGHLYLPVSFPAVVLIKWNNLNWWNFSLRLLCTGAIPFLFLSYINLKIYSRIRQNSQSSVRFTSFSILMIIFVSILTLISKRNRSISAKKAGNLATILILIGDLSFDNHTI